MPRSFNKLTWKTTRTKKIKKDNWLNKVVYTLVCKMSIWQMTFVHFAWCFSLSCCADLSANLYSLHKNRWRTDFDSCCIDCWGVYSLSLQFPGTLTPQGKVIKRPSTNEENPGEWCTAVPSLACICFHSLFVYWIVFAPVAQTWRVVRKAQGKDMAMLDNS